MVGLDRKIILTAKFSRSTVTDKKANKLVLLKWYLCTRLEMACKVVGLNAGGIIQGSHKVRIRASCNFGDSAFHSSVLFRSLVSVDG